MTKDLGLPDEQVDFLNLSCNDWKLGLWYKIGSMTATFLQMALANSLLSSNQQEETYFSASSSMSSKDGVSASEAFQNSTGTFGLPLTNLAR